MRARDRRPPQLTRRDVLIGTSAALVLASDVADIARSSGGGAPERRPPLLGAYAANEPWPDLAAHTALEAQVGVQLPTMSWFQSFDNSWLDEQAGEAARTGHDLLICLQPVHDDGRPVRFADILAGRWDTWLTRYFSAARGHPGDVAVRFAHEPNGTWYPWSLAAHVPCVRDAAEWIDTWRHVAAIARSSSHGKVKLAWCVNSADIGALTAETYWPGDRWVDVIGLDGYNGYGPWTNPYDLFDGMYRRVTRLSSRTPVWLSEVGCREAEVGSGHSKITWISDLLHEARWPSLERVVFFHADKELDWRLSSSPATLAGVRSMLQGMSRVSAPR